MGASESISNIEIGTMRRVDNSNGSVYELSDTSFPKFYYDHSNHIDKIDSWLRKIKLCVANKMYPLPPVIIVDSPKSGKSALLTRIIPKRIHKNFPSSIILYLDFLTLSVPTTNPLIDSLELFVELLIQKMVQLFENVGFEIDRHIINSMNSSQTRLQAIFKAFNVWLCRKKCLCFMVWDEVQRFLVSSTIAGSIFNDITLHEKFHNIAFALTGSGMVSALQIITQLPSNGTSWIAEATKISVFPEVQGDDPITSQADEISIADQMFQLLKAYHPDTTPSNLLDYVTDSNPAVLAYFCQLHKSNNSNPGAMKKTLCDWYAKLWHDFENDSLPLLQRIQEDDPQILSLLLHVASETLDINIIDLSAFGRWSNVFQSLMRQREDGKVKFVGYYGYLILRSCVSKDGTWKIKKVSSPNKLPIPPLWATVTFLNELISGKSQKEREVANQLSNDLFMRCDPTFQFATDQGYSFFFHYFDPNNKYGIFNDPSDVMPFLTYLKYIRNAVAHIKSLGQINVIHLNVPTCLSDWVKILLEKFVNTSLHVI